jgi:glycosyltransferase involved in cell wall biosynthesis
VKVGPGLRVCLVTTGQPSTNPRAVKEADALAQRGCDVRLVGAHWAQWAADSDGRLVESRKWACTVIDWRRETAPALFWKSRLRHRVARACMKVPLLNDLMLPAAAGRLTPELAAEAMRTPADLFIAHNVGALPAAAAAAARHRARLGFDAEDYHSGEFAADDRSSAKLAVARAESRYIPMCDYVTAAAPGIAGAYAPLARNGPPTPVLNVFPLAARPAKRRDTSAEGPVRAYWFSQTIGPHRGLEDVVRAMGRLGDVPVELHLRGTWQAGYREDLSRVAVQAGLPLDRLVSHEPAHPDDMVRLAAEFDIGLALEPGLTPNSSMLLSNKVFTYLLAGAALIATKTAGQRALLALIEPAARGYEPGDVDGLVHLLHEWTGDRAALDRARAAAWDYGSARYNWDREQETFLEAVARA